MANGHFIRLIIIRTTLYNLFALVAAQRAGEQFRQSAVIGLHKINYLRHHQSG